MPFQSMLVQHETQIALSRIWTLVTNSISFDNNCYAKYTFKLAATLPKEHCAKMPAPSCLTVGTRSFKNPTDQLKPDFLIKDQLRRPTIIWTKSCLSLMFLE